MSFFKSFLLAILATVFLTYVFGTSMVEIMNLHVMIDGEALAPLTAIGFSALVVAIMVVVALTIVLSMFGGLIFLALLVVGGIGMAFIGVFWPVLLIAVVIWLFSRNNQVREFA